MNRAQRRAKPRTPTIFEVRTAFILIDKLFDDLRTGSLEFASIDGAPEYAGLNLLGVLFNPIIGGKSNRIIATRTATSRVLLYLRDKESPTCVAIIARQNSYSWLKYKRCKLFTISMSKPHSAF